MSNEIFTTLDPIPVLLRNVTKGDVILIGNTCYIAYRSRDNITLPVSRLPDGKSCRLHLFKTPQVRLIGRVNADVYDYVFAVNQLIRDQIYTFMIMHYHGFGSGDKADVEALKRENERLRSANGLMLGRWNAVKDFINKPSLLDGGKE